MRGLIAFGIVLPSSEPTEWTRKFSVPVIGLKIIRHSAFKKIYSNGASFHKRMAAAQSKPILNCSIKATSREVPKRSLDERL